MYRLIPFDKRNLIANKSIWLFVILFIGLFLRVYDLSNESIWADEGISIRLAHQNLNQIIEDRASGPNLPPLYFIALHYWVALFGDSEFSVRFPSVILGFFSILMMYVVSHQFFDKATSLLSSLLLSLSLFHIRYSQEARPYSLAIFLTLLSMYFFIKLLKKERGHIELAGYILSSILLISSHIYGVFIILSQNVCFITFFLLSKTFKLEYKLNLTKWLLTQCILILLFSPWIVILIAQIRELVQQDFWIPLPTKYSIISTFITYSGSQFLLLFFVILLPFSIIEYEKHGGHFDWKNLFASVESYRWKICFIDTHKVYLLFVWLLSPIILPFIISQFLTPIYLTKYTIFGSLAFYIIVARIISKINIWHVKSIIIVIIIVFSSAHIWQYYTAVDKEQWRDVADYIDTNASKNDLLLFNSGKCLNAVFDYYSKRNDLIKKPFPSEEESRVDE